MNMDNITLKHNSGEIAIIGAGPVGLFQAYACGVLNIPVSLFENRSQLGGQCSALYPEKLIYDVPGFTAISGQQLIDNLVEQINIFKPTIHLNTHIHSLKTQEDYVLVNDLPFKAAIIACGFGACVHTKLALDNADQFENKNIFYDTFPDVTEKDVIVLGGGNSAIDWALHIATKAQNVHIVHRRDFTAFPSSVKQMEQHENLHIHTYHLPHKIIHEHNNFIGLEIASKDQSRIIKSDYVFPFYGMKSDSRALAQFGVQLIHTNGNDKIMVNAETMETSSKRIYAIGDIAHSTTKTKLFSILSGFNEAAIAANHISQHIYQKAASKKHSSDLSF